MNQINIKSFHLSVSVSVSSVLKRKGKQITARGSAAASGGVNTTHKLSEPPTPTRPSDPVSLRAMTNRCWVRICEEIKNGSQKRAINQAWSITIFTLPQTVQLQLHDAWTHRFCYVRCAAKTNVKPMGEKKKKQDAGPETSKLVWKKLIWNWFNELPVYVYSKIREQNDNRTNFRPVISCDPTRI